MRRLCPWTWGGFRLFRGSRKKEPSEESLFDIDYEHGTIKRKTDGIRVIALGSVGWATLEKELTSTFISGAAVILQRMGYSYGRYIGNAARSQRTTPTMALGTLQSFAKESGWGELVLNGGDLVGGQARLVLKNCVFCLHIREATEPVCHMLTGLVGGVADEVIGGAHRVVEDKCVGKGDSVCEIVVERVGEA
jgi:predicted hydrocarbon binding protein